MNLTDEQKLFLYRQRYKIEYLKEKWPQPSKLFQSYLFINGTKDRVCVNTNLIQFPLGYLLLMVFSKKTLDRFLQTIVFFAQEKSASLTISVDESRSTTRLPLFINYYLIFEN